MREPVEHKEHAEYTGFKQVMLNDEELAKFYGNLSDNKFECLINEYVIIEDSSGNVVDQLRWNGEIFVAVKPKVIDNEYVGKIKPRNIQQVLAMDLLMNTDITVKILGGQFGRGKDHLMIGTALDLIKKNKYEKLIFLRNNWELQDTKSLGAIPGGINEKLLPWAGILLDKIGGYASMEFMINRGMLEIEHLGFIRGRDYQSSALVVSESQNLTVSQLALIVGRVGTGSAVFFNGDFKQVDDKLFERNNGLLTAIDKLKGNKLFGYVKLLKNERGETSQLADILLDT
jgi:predicted ribonuclease YlaK